jgi:hypothetical protein
MKNAKYYRYKKNHMSNPTVNSSFHLHSPKNEFESCNTSGFNIYAPSVVRNGDMGYDIGEEDQLEEDFELNI